MVVLAAKVDESITPNASAKVNMCFIPTLYITQLVKMRDEFVATCSRHQELAKIVQRGIRDTSNTSNYGGIDSRN